MIKTEPQHDKTNKNCPVWSESSLSTWRKLGFLATHWAQSEDSDQTVRMPRLILVFAGHTVTLLVLSCCCFVSKLWQWRSGYSVSGLFSSGELKLYRSCHKKTFRLKTTRLARVLHFVHSTYTMNNKGPDQTASMCRLICAFVSRIITV